MEIRSIVINESCGIDLMKEINTKREELNHKVKDGLNKDTLLLSQELDGLIVKYMLNNDEKLK